MGDMREMFDPYKSSHKQRARYRATRMREESKRL